MSRRAHEVLETLATIRREAERAVGAEDAERIGTREVELVRRNRGRETWPALRELSDEGLVQRSGGWIWITDDGLEEVAG